MGAKGNNLKAISAGGGGLCFFHHGHVLNIAGNMISLKKKTKQNKKKNPKKKKTFLSHSSLVRVTLLPW